MALSPEQVALVAAAAARDKKAKEVLILDISELTLVCDYFVICSGLSSPQVKAITENVETKLEEQGLKKLRVEGLREGYWVLLDYGTVVIHIFQENERRFYNLEHLWGDARVVHL